MLKSIFIKVNYVLKITLEQCLEHVFLHFISFSRSLQALEKFTLYWFQLLKFTLLTNFAGSIESISCGIVLKEKLVMPLRCTIFSGMYI